MRPLPAALLALALSAVPTVSRAQAPAPAPSTGLLVMAHGGTPEWDAAIQASVDLLGEETPTVVAFGMAEPAALSAALDSLARLDVGRVVVVRMFVSGASFLQQTQYLLGLSDNAPDVFVMHAGHVSHEAPPQIQHGLEIATHPWGLMGSRETADIVYARAAALSRDPAHESVLLIAHGMGDESENAEVIAAMEAAVAPLADLGFARTGVMTLREDWPQARVEEEHRIRDFVRTESAAGRGVLVLPYRLNGFGPYADVLAGERYVAGEGFVPHDAVTHWIARTATEVSCSHSWGPLFTSC